jgi:hypothetical protein
VSRIRCSANGSVLRIVGCVFAIAAATTSPSPARAGKADIVAVRTICTPDRVCGFVVTVKHADTGWNHYANRFEIVGPDGALIATRVLEHPHVHEQPFTRTLGGVAVPAGIERVTLRAHDSVHGYGGDEVTVDIVITDPAASKDERD